MLNDISSSTLISGKAYIWKKNYDALKSIINGDNTYGVPKKFGEKIKDIYKNIDKIKNLWNGYMTPKAMSRVKPLTINT